MYNTDRNILYRERKVNLQANNANKGFAYICFCFPKCGQIYKWVCDIVKRRKIMFCFNKSSVFFSVTEVTTLGGWGGHFLVINQGKTSCYDTFLMQSLYKTKRRQLIFQLVFEYLVDDFPPSSTEGKFGISLQTQLCLEDVANSSEVGSKKRLKNEPQNECLFLYIQIDICSKNRVCSVPFCAFALLLHKDGEINMNKVFVIQRQNSALIVVVLCLFFYKNKIT